MILHLNGEQRDFPEGIDVALLVERLGMKTDRVAVELNLEIVPRADWQKVQLKEGDRLEIVHFVGGGMDSRKERNQDGRNENGRQKDKSRR